MLVMACLSTVKVCKRSFHHCRCHLKNVLDGLSAGRDSKHRFSHRGRLPMVVKSCRSFLNVYKHRFTHLRSLVKLVQAF